MAISRSNIKAGGAFVELLLDRKRFTRGLRRARRELRAFSRTLSRIRPLGAFGGGAGGGIFRVFTGVAAAAALAFPIKLAANLEIAEAQFTVLTGSAKVARKTISELEQFSKIALIPAEDLQRGAQTLLGYGAAAGGIVSNLKALAEISRGSAERFNRLTLALGQTFAKTRLYAQEVRQFVEAGLNPLQQIAQKTGETMGEVADRMADGAISAEEVAAALQDAVGPLGRFNGLLKKMGETADGLWTRFQVGMKLALRPIGKTFFPAIKNLLRSVIKLIPKFSEWIKQNEKIVVAVYAGAAALTVLTGAFFATGLGLAVLGVAMGGFGSVLSLVLSGVGILAGALTAVLNPIGLGVVAVVALTAAYSGLLRQLQQTAVKLVDEMGVAFGEVKNIADRTLGGIVDSLKSGDLALAMKVAAAGMSLAFHTGTRPLFKTWLNFKNFFLKTTDDMVFGAKKKWLNFYEELGQLTSNTFNRSGALLTGLFEYARGIEGAGEKIFNALSADQKAIYLKLSQGSKIAGEVFVELTRDDPGDPRESASAIRRIRESTTKQLDILRADKVDKIVDLERQRMQASADRIDANRKESKVFRDLLAQEEKDLQRFLEMAAAGARNTLAQAEQAAREAEKKLIEPFEILPNVVSPDRFKPAGLDEVEKRRAPDVKEVMRDVFSSFSAAALAAQGQGGGNGQQKVVQAIEKEGKLRAVDNVKLLDAMLFNMGLNP